MKHTNKIALITGGSRGLGRNTALKLARDGADVIVTYRERQDEGKAVLAEIEKLGRKAALLQLDVANTAGFDTFARTVAETLQDRWQRKDFDFLINNAGIDVYSPFDQTTEDAFDRLLNVHFRGVYFLTQRMLPLVANGGRIVCTSTGLTRFAIPGYAAYASMKGAIEVLIKYLAKELGSRGEGLLGVEYSVGTDRSARRYRWRRFVPLLGGRSLGQRATAGGFRWYVPVSPVCKKWVLPEYTWEI
jgi:NAD(P)-dependent dehydrogenase (short-subunit alcohol dehydrogenase family)